MDVYDFGLRLKELRQKRGLSQADVARRLGLTRATISGYECNTSTPSIEQLVNMAVLYNASLDYIVGLEKRPCIFLEGLTPPQVQTVTSVVELLKKSYIRDNNIS